MSAASGSGPFWLVEFDSAANACAAARVLRAGGYETVDLHAPREIPEAFEALGLPRPRYLPRLVLAFALAGALTGYALQWYSSVATPNGIVGARPVHAAPAFVPVTFELAVLFGSAAAFVGLFARRPSLRLWQPVFEVEGFERASIDRYWLRLAGSVDRNALEALLASLRPGRIERIDA